MTTLLRIIVFKGSYEKALNEAKDEWRSFCDENHYGIDPEDYDSEYDYEAAVEDASYDEW